jgi:hypothetical protein
MTEETRPITAEGLTNVLVDLAVESWRFGRLFGRLLSKLDAAEQGRLRSQARWFERKLAESLTLAGLRIVNIEGQPFDPGLAATPINIEDFEVDDRLIVDQMLDPIIMGSNGLVRTGTVTVRKIES